MNLTFVIVSGLLKDFSTAYTSISFPVYQGESQDMVPSPSGLQSVQS